MKFDQPVTEEPKETLTESNPSLVKFSKQKNDFRSLWKFLADTIGDLKELGMIVVFMCVSQIIKVQQKNYLQDWGKKMKKNEQTSHLKTFILASLVSKLSDTVLDRVMSRTKTQLSQVFKARMFY